MPNRKSCRGRRKTLKRESLARLNGSSGPSEADSHELEAKAASPMPSREASVDHSEASLIGDIQSLEHIDQEQEQVSEIVKSLLQNHDRMDLGRRYCLLSTIHEATPRGCRALSKPMWNLASIADMMSDDLDITEVVVLDHTTAIIHVGQQSAGEGLTEEEAQACIEHFSPYIEWRDMAIKQRVPSLDPG